MEVELEAELRSLATVTASATAALCYCYLLVPSLRPGKPRLLSLLPVIYLLARLPFLFSTIHLRGISAFFLAWLGIFKLLLFAFDLGPLSIPGLSLPAFVALAALPVKIQQQPTNHPPPETPTNPPKSPPDLLPVPPLLGFAAKGAILAFLVSLYPDRHRYPRGTVIVMYGLHIYLALDLVLASTALLSRGLLGRALVLEPQFSTPYLSSSLRDFWGRRWNLMVTRLLHPAVYAPVRARWGPLAGVMAAFLVSGVMHEVMFYYLILRGPTGEVTSFFLLQGVSVIVEAAARGREKKGWWGPLPRAVTGPLVVAYVWGTGMLLFFPPILRSDAEEKVVGECLAMFGMAKAAVRKAVAHVL